MTGLKIAAGVATVVMAFVAIIALINGIIGGVGGWFWFCQCLSGKHFSAMCWPRWHGIMGVDWSDANLAGSLIGQKLAINEFVAYLNFFALSANERHAGCQDHCHYLVRPLWVCKLWFYRCCRWAFSAISPKRAPGNRPAVYTGAGGGDAFQPDERDHCRVLYWFA